MKTPFALSCHLSTSGCDSDDGFVWSFLKEMCFLYPDDGPVAVASAAPASIPTRVGEWREMWPEEPLLAGLPEETPEWLDGVDADAAFTVEKAAEIMPNALKEVGTIMEQLESGLSVLVQPEQIASLLNSPPHLRRGLANVMDHLEKNTRETLKWTIWFQKHGLSQLQRGCDAAAKAVGAAHEVRNAPMDKNYDEIKQLLKIKIRRHVKVFGDVMDKVPDSLFQDALSSLNVLEHAWSDLGSKVEHLIDDFKQFQVDTQKEIAKLKRMSVACKIGAAIVVVAGVAATVGCALLTGGGSLPAEAAACAAFFAVSGSASICHRLKQKSDKLDARAAAALSKVETAAACTTFLTASLHIASKAFAADASVEEAEDGKIIADTMVDLLKDLKNKVKDIAAQVEKTHAKIELVKISWDKLTDGFKDANVMEEVEWVVEDFMHYSLSDLEDLKSKQDIATRKVTDLEHEVTVLAEKALEAFSSFTQGKVKGMMTMAMLVDKLREDLPEEVAEGGASEDGAAEDSKKAAVAAA